MANQGEQKYAGFSIAGRRFAMPVEALRGIVHEPELVPVPDGPDFLSGFAVFADGPVAVLDLALLFQLPAFEGDASYVPLLLLAGKSSRFAVRVHGLEGVVSVPGKGRRPLAEEDSFNGCGVAMLDDGDSPMIELDPQRLLLERERQAIEKEQERMEQRLASVSA